MAEMHRRARLHLAAARPSELSVVERLASHDARRAARVASGRLPQVGSGGKRQAGRKPLGH